MSGKKNNKRKSYNAIELETEKGKKEGNQRTFKISNSHRTWVITGIRTTSIIDKREVIFFAISGFPNYTFMINKGDISGRKIEIKSPSDSGILAKHENRFNLVDNEGNRKTLRLSSLIEILPLVFNGVLSNEAS